MSKQKKKTHKGKKPMPQHNPWRIDINKKAIFYVTGDPSLIAEVPARMPPLPKNLTATIEQKAKVISDWDIDAKQRQQAADKILKEYENKLLAGHYGDPKDIVLSGNIIDMYAAQRAFRTNTDLMPRFQEWFESNPDQFFTSIPCFQSGAIRLFYDYYIQWEIVDIDIAKREFTAKIMSYHQYLDHWAPGVSGRFKCQAPVGQEIKIGPDETDDTIVQSYYDVYSKIPAGWFDWSPLETKVWYDMIMDYARRARNKLMSEHNATNFLWTVGEFVSMNQLCNFYLATNKIDRPKKEHGHAIGVLLQSSDEPVPQDARKIRKIGLVHIKSSKIPRPPSEATVCKYKTASWTARGHIRHYKSGKTVYVKPAVKRRHCLQNTDAAIIANQTLVMIPPPNKEDKTPQ